MEGGKEPCEVHDQCDQKKSPNFYKKLPKSDFTRKIIDFDTFRKKCLRMWEIWAN